MFTGIIYTTGRIKNKRIMGKNTQLDILAAKDILSAEKGMSIAVNGACLTAVAFKGRREFTADVTEETVKKTTIKGMKAGDTVNIEFPVTAGNFLSGHIVQGHVDTEADICSVNNKEGSAVIEIAFPPVFSKYVVEKGSVAVDGISLTAFGVKKDKFSVAVIPETLKETIISKYRKGIKVNIEFDIIGKYVEKFIKNR